MTQQCQCGRELMTPNEVWTGECHPCQANPSVQKVCGLTITFGYSSECSDGINGHRCTQANRHRQHHGCACGMRWDSSGSGLVVGEGQP